MSENSKRNRFVVLNTNLIQNINTLINTTRPAFLVLSPVCIFLGYCTALAAGAKPETYLVVLVFVGAICAHISVNTFNEYFDFKSGLDDLTHRTPFSGGSSALQNNPTVAVVVLYLAGLTLVVTILLGIYFICLRGWSLLILLLTGVFIIFTYTTWLNRHPLLCLIAPGLSFGVLFVTGSHIVLAGHYHLLAIYVSMVPFLLVNNLLLLNQYPDIEADRCVDRRHFPIVYGTRSGNMVYAGSAGLTIVIIIYGVSSTILPGNSLYALLPMVPAVAVLYGACKYAGNIDKLIPYLGINVFITMATPLILGMSLLMS